MKITVNEDYFKTLEQLADTVDEWLNFPHIRGKARLEQEATALLGKITRHLLDELHSPEHTKMLLGHWDG